MGNDNLRMGGPKKVNVPRILLFVVILLVLGAGSYLLTVILRSSDKPAGKARVGCQGDDECDNGTMCVAGGCMIMLSSEHRGIWKDDIAAQLDGGVGWEPAPSFGQKILEAKTCPLKQGDFRKTDYKHVVPLVRVNLYEVATHSLFIHKMLKAKGTMWLESLRLSFPSWARLNKNKLCGSSYLDSFYARMDDEGNLMGSDFHVAFKQAVPVGGDVTILVKAEVDLPAADAEGFRSMTMELNPRSETEDDGHTVLALPLGSSLVSIEGPPPAKQRLLTGYVAYYWEHDPEPGEVTVRFKVPEFSGSPLDLKEINP